MSVLDYGRQARRRLDRTVTRNRLRFGLADEFLGPDEAIRSLPAEPHLVFCCYGNICRSPMAERYARQRLAERDLPATVASTGFHDTTERTSPDPAVATAAEHEVDLDDHRSGRVTEAMLRDADLVLLMDVLNYRLLEQEYPWAVEEATFLRLFGDGDRWSFEIADPHGDDSDAFDRAYEQVAASVDGLVDRLAAQSAARTGV